MYDNKYLRYDLDPTVSIFFFLSFIQVFICDKNCCLMWHVRELEISRSLLKIIVSKREGNKSHSNDRIHTKILIPSVQMWSSGPCWPFTSLRRHLFIPGTQWTTVSFACSSIREVRSILLFSKPNCSNTRYPVRCASIFKWQCRNNWLIIDW